MSTKFKARCAGAGSLSIAAVLAGEREDRHVPYRVKRILLKSGEIVTEKELGADENYSSDATPVVGDVINVCCRGRHFDARVVWGNWPGRTHAAGTVVPLRVEEI
jgi:hypothetical protein